MVFFLAFLNENHLQSDFNFHTHMDNVNILTQSVVNVVGKPVEIHEDYPNANLISDRLIRT
jgi:hypothetical protein